MSKVYFCKQQKDSEICGESNPDNFPKGRYSICKDCKLEYHKKQSHQKYLRKKAELTVPIVERMNKNLGDNGSNTKELLLQTLSYDLIGSMELTIPEKFIELETKCNKIYNEMNSQNIELNKKITLLKTENKCLRNLIQKIGSKLDSYLDKKQDDENSKFFASIKSSSI
jgi:hypothetical protein